MIAALRRLARTLTTSWAGMRITARYLAPGTEVTRQYPEEPAVAFERTRGRLALEPEACIGCGICVRTCPIECIAMEAVRRDTGKGKRPVRFVVRMERCMFCGLCVEACPTRALRHTARCDFAAWDPADLAPDLAAEAGGTA